MENKGKSGAASQSAVLEAAVLGPLERAAAEDTDPLMLLDTEDALRSIGKEKTLAPGGLTR